MTKTVRITLDENNNLILKYEKVCRQIEDFLLSTKYVYDLLYYSCGDDYDIQGKKDVVNPIEMFFHKIIKGIKKYSRSHETSKRSP